jgi:hypothetical protein
MPNVNASLLLTLTLLTGCATTPLEVACPKPAEMPESLKQPASTGPSLTQQYESLLLELRESLRRAMLP